MCKSTKPCVSVLVLIHISSYRVNQASYRLSSKHNDRAETSAITWSLYSDLALPRRRFPRLLSATHTSAVLTAITPSLAAPQTPQALTRRGHRVIVRAAHIPAARPCAAAPRYRFPWRRAGLCLIVARAWQKTTSTSRRAKLTKTITQQRIWGATLVCWLHLLKF